MFCIETPNDTLQRVVFSSNLFHSTSKVRQGGDERATLIVQLAQLGMSEEVNAVSPMK
jgi:hypothetical protein